MKRISLQQQVLRELQAIGVPMADICEATLSLAQLPTEKQEDVRLSILAVVKYHLPPLAMDREQKSVIDEFQELFKFYQPRKFYHQ